jgi:hypothetical protein
MPGAERLKRPALAAAGVILLLPPGLWAKPEYTHITKQECSYCHASLKDRKLTEAGLYFREHRTLKGFISKKPPESNPNSPPETPPVTP